jgi:hypothetical protein
MQNTISMRAMLREARLPSEGRLMPASGEDRVIGSTVGAAAFR